MRRSASGWPSPPLNNFIIGNAAQELKRFHMQHKDFFAHDHMHTRAGHAHGHTMLCAHTIMPTALAKLGNLPITLPHGVRLRSRIELYRDVKIAVYASASGSCISPVANRSLCGGIFHGQI
jgi:hypothetical protein